MLTPWICRHLSPISADNGRQEVSDEPARQQALTSAGILDPAPEKSFDRITEIA
jgi:hypothetical protein